MKLYRFSALILIGIFLVVIPNLSYATASDSVDLKNFEQDPFGSFHIKAHQIKKPSDLSLAVKKILAQYPGMGIYFHQDITDSKWVKLLKTLGFTMDAALDEAKKILWINRDGRDIPPFARQRMTASVFIYCPGTKRFLFVKDKTLGWAVPGGFVEPQEYIPEGAAREAFEEAAVTLPPADLKLAGLMTIIKDNPMFGKMKTQIHVFVAFVDKEQGKPDGKETTDLQWFAAEDVEQKQQHEGTRFHPFVLQFLKAARENPRGVSKPVSANTQVIITEPFKDVGIQ